MTTSHRHVPADATVLEDTVVGAGLPWSGRIDRGEHLVLVDLEGQQAIDFLCYNAHDPHERYHAPNTVNLQGTSTKAACMSPARLVPTVASDSGLTEELLYESPDL